MRARAPRVLVLVLVLALDPRHASAQPPPNDLHTAQHALAFFDYAGAADAYVRVAKDVELLTPARRDAARNAIVLSAMLERRDDLPALRATYASLSPPEGGLVEIDVLVATKVADPKARARALAAAFATHRPRALGHPALVEAAHDAAMIHLEARQIPEARKWLRETVTAWEWHRAKSPSPPLLLASDRITDLAAEADLHLLDLDIGEHFDAPGRHVDMANAELWDRRLEEAAKRYGASPWAVAFVVRQGQVWDRSYERLHTADAARLLVRRYQTAIVMAERANVYDAYIAHARSRLARYATMLGDPALARFDRTRAGLPVPPRD